MAAIGAALAAPAASAAEGPSPAQPATGTLPAGTPAPEPTNTPTPPAGVEQGSTLEAPPVAVPETDTGNGGVSAGERESETSAPETEPTGTPPLGATPAPSPGLTFPIPSIPSSTCTSSGVPPILVPIYQRAAIAYDLGVQGPSVLAGINQIETAFGTNLNVSSAGAQGWMQFMPETWAAYGVDANGDGVKDPYNPEDAIFSAANYLSASGMPEDTYGAIYAYNHADWYVAEVLANAACHAPAVGGGALGAVTPELRVLNCEPAPAWHKEVPEDYLTAFEAAASRYDLGRRGVWALAAIARLESDFGRGMSKQQLRENGPLGLEPSEWSAYAVDGNEDGRIQRGSVADSAATLARLIWSRGGLRAGVFTHNQAQWYVQAVLAEADRIEGNCKVTTVSWQVEIPESLSAPINWDNLTLSNELELQDIQSGTLDPRLLALLGAITQKHQVTISSLRSDHSQYTVEGGVSNHYFGRAMDIAAVDGVSCTDTGTAAPCAELGLTLAALPAPLYPTELIYCFDLDGAGPAFARADHCDHIHAGYDG